MVKSAVVWFPDVVELLIDNVATVSSEDVAEKIVSPPLVLIEEMLTVTGKLEFTRTSSIALTSTYVWVNSGVPFCMAK